jgi:hypothetical protein
MELHLIAETCPDSYNYLFLLQYSSISEDTLSNFTSVDSIPAVMSNGHVGYLSLSLDETSV